MLYNKLQKKLLTQGLFHLPLAKTYIMRKLLFVFMASLFVFGNCHKDDASPTSTIDFLPLNSGTFWNYLVVNTAATTTTSNLLLTVTAKDTTVNAKTYKVLSNSTGANNYWAKVGNDYYRYGIIPGAALLGSVEELYFKDNVSANGTWTNTFSVNYNGTPVPVTANYKIAAVGQSKIVTAGTSSNTFSDVTQVQVSFTTTVPIFGIITLGTGDFYYAKGVGLVAQSISIAANPLLGITTASSVVWNIQSYQIK